MANLLRMDLYRMRKAKSFWICLGIAFALLMLNGMLCLLSACSFFYADMENGYIKNIAGQMPRRGFTVLSKYLAILPHNLLFMVAGIIGNLIGTVLFQQILLDGDILDAAVTFLMKVLLMQSICAILLMVTASFQNKSLGTVIAVLMGLGLMSLVYMMIDTGLDQLFQNKGFSVSDYMPDQLLGQLKPPVLDSILVSAATTALFLPLSVHVFDRRDVK